MKTSTSPSVYQSGASKRKAATIEASQHSITPVQQYHLQKEKEKIMRRRAVLTREIKGGADSASQNINLLQPAGAAGSMRQQMLAVETEAMFMKSARHQKKPDLKEESSRH